MRKNNIYLMAAAFTAATMLTAKGDFRDERRLPAYKSAMADYSAGRLNEATATFEKVIRADGENASARFQLACLLQDYRHDYMGAICQYREYLRLEPGSDKASLAKERLALCEEALAKELAQKYGILSSSELSEEFKRLRAKADSSAAALAKSEKALSAAVARSTSLMEENERLRRMLARMSEATAGGQNEDAAEPHKIERPDIEEVLADEKDSSGPENFTTDAKALGIEDEKDDEKVGRSLAEAKAIAEELAAEDDAAPVLLDSSAPKAEQKLSDFVASRSSDSKDDERAKDRPESYVVQDGDTLYKIALRFYGKTSAWKLIRDANKATISTDGRIQSGQKIVLP